MSCWHLLNRLFFPGWWFSDITFMGNGRAPACPVIKFVSLWVCGSAYVKRLPDELPGQL